MSASFDLGPVDRITTGAVGRPGDRTFFLQARAGRERLTILAEKEQVRLLSQALIQMLQQIPEREEGSPPDAGDLELEEPLEPEWHAGEMSVEYSEVEDRIAIVIREAQTEEEPVPEPGVARLEATREQARALAIRALEVVAAGRPRCQLCWEPINEGEEHRCPALNGHRDLQS